MNKVTKEMLGIAEAGWEELAEKCRHVAREAAQAAVQVCDKHIADEGEAAIYESAFVVQTLCAYFLANCFAITEVMCAPDKLTTFDKATLVSEIVSKANTMVDMEFKNRTVN